MHKSKTSMAKKLLSLAMALVMALSLLPTAALAAEGENNSGDSTGAYVLMNIPYSEFYAAEKEEGQTAATIDAVTSATKSKPFGTLATGSYHVADHNTASTATTVDISGIIYPVYVSDLSALSQYKQVKDSDTLSITVNNRGKEVTTEYKGSETLFENPSYSYYYLGTTLPNSYKSYKVLTVDDNNTLSFGKVKGAEVQQVTNASAALSTGGRHTYYEIKVTGLDAVTASNVSAVTLTTADNNVYGLRHVYEIWRGTELGFNADDTRYGALQGKTISKITYYLNDGSIYYFDTNLKVLKKTSAKATVTSVAAGTSSTTVNVTGLPDGTDGSSAYNPVYTVTRVTKSGEETVTGAWVSDTTLYLPTTAKVGYYKLTITDANNNYAPITANFALTGYVLMNIPYNDFYTAETSDTEGATAAKIDAVSSATKSKPLSGSLAAGSYHVNSDGSDITGIIYPVEITAKNASVLANYTEVTDESSVDITTTLRGNTSTTTYKGADALFESASYSYYALAVEPAAYKKLTVASSGRQTTMTFGNSTAEAASLAAEAKLSTGGHHTYYEIDVTETDAENAKITSNNVAGVVLTTTDGNTYGLRHVYEIWRGTELGFNADDTRYGALQGKTIKTITYYLNRTGNWAVYTIDLATDESDGLKIPESTESYTLEVADVTPSDTVTSTTITSTLPTAFDAAYNLTKGDEDVTSKFTIENNTISWTGTPDYGSYTLTATDSKGTYASKSATFEIKDPTVYGAYDASGKKLVKASDSISDDAFTAYLKAITSVSVGDTSYSASGRGAVVIITSDTGAINLTAKSGDTGIFEAGKTYDVTVSATGYQDLTFSLTVPASSGGGGHSSGGSGSTAYAVTTDSAQNGTVSVSAQSAAKGSTVTVTVTPDTGYTLDTLTVKDAGGSTVATTKKSDTQYTFTMPAGKVTVTAAFKTAGTTTPTGSGFTDVTSSDYFAEAVQWAVDKGITTGTTSTTFSPNASCTRAQMVTFLWRTAGSPAPTATNNPFSDVSSDAYYYNAVLWAVEKGITKGTSDTTFSPNRTVTRGQTVTFLYRFNSTPAAAGTNGFTDVQSTDYYADAVQWAVNEAITKGTSDTTFRPNSDCTRGQIVTFLYRDQT